VGRWHSFSSVSTYETCPRKWQFQYQRRLKVERQVPVHWRFGTVVHAALEAAVNWVVENKHSGNLVPATEAAMAALHKAFEDEDMPDREWDRAVGIVQESLEDLEVDWNNVLGVEQQLQTRSPDGSEFIGYMDLILRLGPTSVLIRDYKVRSTQSTADELVNDPQLNLYGWFVRQLYPWVETVYAEHYYPPIQKSVRVTLTQEGMLDTLLRWEAGVEATEMDESFEPVVSEWCDSCVYRDQCPAWIDKVPTDQLQF